MLYIINLAPYLPKVLQSLTQMQEGMGSLGNLKDCGTTVEQVSYFQIFWNLGWANHDQVLSVSWRRGGKNKQTKARKQPWG